MLDCEFVNRFLAFYLLGIKAYSGNLEDYLNSVMGRLQVEPESTIEKCRVDFLKAMKYASDIFGDKAFRKINVNEGYGRINKPLYDSVPFLALEGEKLRVPDAMCLQNGKTNRLIDQVSAWMAEISPGIRISAELLPSIEKAKLAISYSGDRLVSDSFLPVNVGFGIPYVLPLIVELLISNKDSLLLIENPESHLHPKGQTMIANLIALAAEHGCQIICESHSDHVITGIRVAIKKKQINNRKVGISFFSKNKEQETKVDNIYIDSKGNLSEYPFGLLDEWGILMTELI